MPISEKYKFVVAIMDDPIYRSIIEREIRRQKNRSKVLPPPVLKESGGYVFPTMRQWQETPYTKAKPTAIELWDQVADIFTDGEVWFISLQDGTEVGPFPTAKFALQEAISLLTSAGWTFLAETPWGEEESAAYPL